VESHEFPLHIALDSHDFLLHYVAESQIAPLLYA
jgi:hypothetical protein